MIQGASSPQGIGDLLAQISAQFPGNKPVQVAIICVALLSIVLGSGVGGYFIHAPGPSPKTVYVTPTPEPNLPLVVDFDYIHYGVVRNVTIINAYVKSIPTLNKGEDTDFCNTEYSVSGGQQPTLEAFQDSDEGAKTNSGDVFATCSLYAINSGAPQAGKPVTLVVSGIRFTPNSLFRNILRIIPQS